MRTSFIQVGVRKARHSKSEYHRNLPVVESEFLGLHLGMNTFHHGPVNESRFVEILSLLMPEIWGQAV